MQLSRRSVRLRAPGACMAAVNLPTEQAGIRDGVIDLADAAARAAGEYSNFVLTRVDITSCG
jgi:hypothetical protein